MALLDFDSFDYYQTANIPQVYDAADVGFSFIVPGFGRCGTNCLKVAPTPGSAGPIRGVAAADNRFIVGCAVNNTPTGSNAPTLFRLRNGGNVFMDIHRNTDGSIAFRLSPGAPFGPTIFTSFGGLLPGNQWHHIGIDMVIDGTNGSVTIAIDGVVLQTATGLETYNAAGPGSWTSVQLGGPNFSSGATVYYDDFYCMDGTGPAPWNALLGDVHVQRLRPIAPGALTQFTVVGAPTNWQAVDDGDTPDTSSYVTSNVAGTTDTYTYEDIAVVPGQIIYGVKESALANKDVAGNRTLEFLKRNGGVNYPLGAALGIPTGINNYAYIATVAPLDPKTAAQWANEAAVNGSSGNQFGITLAT